MKCIGGLSCRSAESCILSDLPLGEDVEGQSHPTTPSVGVFRQPYESQVSSILASIFAAMIRAHAPTWLYLAVAVTALRTFVGVAWIFGTVLFDGNGSPPVRVV